VLRVNYGFVGREAILARTKSAITESKLTTNRKPLVLVGVGGIGKTQLMLQYCYTCESPSSYRYIFWIDTDGEITLADSPRRLACNLGLAEEGNVAEALKTWLEHKTEWLLLVNNADNQPSST
jgi:hypothetical protein